MTAPGLNVAAIVSALGDRFEAATIGTPTGAPAMREVYRDTPKSVPAVPSVVLEVQNGTIEHHPSGLRRHRILVDAVFLLSKRPADPARVEADRKRWLPYLLHATVDRLALGLSAATGYSVIWAQPTGWDFVEFASEGSLHDGISVHHEIVVDEPVDYTQ